jgi:hypothetical protein
MQGAWRAPAPAPARAPAPALRCPPLGGRAARGARRAACAAAPDGNAPSSRFSAVERLTKKLLGYSDPPPEEAEAAEAPLPAPAAPPPHPAPAAPGAAPAAAAADPEEGSWEWWTAYFDAMDDAVRELEGVDEEMAAAVAAEDYAAAAALRVAQRRLELLDSVGSVLEGLEAAVAEERYSDAAALRDGGGAGLLGWWVGRGEGEDAQGHLLHVTPDFGRYVAHAYTGANIAELTVRAGAAAGRRGLGWGCVGMFAARRACFGSLLLSLGACPVFSLCFQPGWRILPVAPSPSP